MNGAFYVYTRELADTMERVVGAARAGNPICDKSEEPVLTPAATAMPPQSQDLCLPPLIRTQS